MSIQVRRYSEVAALPVTCVQLVERCASLQFDQSLEWYAALASHGLGSEQRIRIYAAFDAADEAVALLPMRYAANVPWFAQRTLQSLATYYTSLYAPIVDPQADLSAVLRSLCEALRADRAQWDLLDFAPLDDAAPATIALQEQLQRAGFAVHRYSRFGNWYLPTGQRSFADYFANRASQLRNTVNRKGKKLRAQPEIRIEVVSSAEALEPHLAAYQQVYAASWKVPEPFVEFVPQMVRALCRRGWLRLGVVYLGAVPIAAQLWFVKTDAAYIFKLAYDEQHKSLSAGSVLTTTLMAHVMDVDRVAVVDYLTGDDAYKKDWMSQRRERIGLRVYNQRSLRGALGALESFAGPRVKQLLRRFGKRERQPAA
jgi:hypothetical protein